MDKKKENHNNKNNFDYITNMKENDISKHAESDKDIFIIENPLSNKTLPCTFLWIKMELIEHVYPINIQCHIKKIY